MKWFVFVVFLVGVVLMGTAQADTNETATTQATTTPKPIIKTIDSELCKKCTCDTEVFLLDCRNRTLKTWFTDTDWDVLANGDILFETIRLENNSLTEVPMLKPMPVKNLYLGHNLIEKIEKAAFHNLLNLTILNLSYNKLTSKALKPEVFQGNYNTVDYEPLPFVVALDLGHNDLHTLDSDLFEHLPKLEILILGSNQFQKIDLLTATAIAGLSHLKTLDLSYMELKAFPDTLFHGPRDLQTLILTGNLFTTVPKELEAAINLTKLTIDENLIGDLKGENVFPKLPKLEYLSLSYLNDLVEVGAGALNKLPSLKTLVMSDNPKLARIDSAAFAAPTVNSLIFDYPPIEELYLFNNNLTVLEYDLLKRWDKVNTIDLRANPWACNCDNKWLIHVLISQIRDTNKELVINVNCGSPKAWKSKPLVELNQDEKVLPCTDEVHNDGRLLIGLLIGILVGIPVTFGALILYRRGCFGLFNRGNSGSSLYSRASFQDEFRI